MVAKLTKLTHKIVIQLHLVEESCTICSSRSRRPVRKLLDTPKYVRGLGKVLYSKVVCFKHSFRDKAMNLKESETHNHITYTYSWRHNLLIDWM
jgi:C4-type Zn-finger protein